MEAADTTVISMGASIKIAVNSPTGRVRRLMNASELVSASSRPRSSCSQG